MNENTNILSENGIQSDDCLFCASKHLGQAYVLMIEAFQGYVGHRWLANGHLAEAERETLQGFKEISEKIRDLRLKISGQSDEKWKFSDITDLIMEIRKEAEILNDLSEKDHLYRNFTGEVPQVSYPELADNITNLPHDYYEAPKQERNPVINNSEEEKFDKLAEMEELNKFPYKQEEEEAPKQSNNSSWPC